MTIPMPSDIAGKPCDSYELPCCRNGRCFGRGRFVYSGTDPDGTRWFMGDYEGANFPQRTASNLADMTACPFNENILMYINEKKPKPKGAPAAFTGTPFDLLMLRVNK